MTGRRRGRTGRALATLASACALLAAGSAAGQDLEPRLYSNAPVGLNFAIAGYTYSTGEVATDASLPIEDGEIEVHSAVVAYARSFGIFGTSGKADVVVPYGWLSGSATLAGQPVRRRVDGLGDPRLRLSLNLYGAPALTLEEYADYEQGLIVGTSLSVTVPLGQYDDDRVVNLGTNRWSIKPELGVSKQWHDRFTTELSGAVTLYTDNDDFFGGRRREQEPIYSLQGHAVLAIWRGVWASFDATWYSGGRTAIDGVRNDDRIDNTRLGGTLALPLSRYLSIKLYASSGVSTRTGGDFDTVGTAVQARWGGGL